jgi:hypothetical protein
MPYRHIQGDKQYLVLLDESRYLVGDLTDVVLDNKGHVGHARLGKVCL